MNYSEAKTELFQQLKRNMQNTDYGSCTLTTAIVSFDKYTISVACVRQYSDWYINKTFAANDGEQSELLHDALDSIIADNVLEEIYDEWQAEKNAEKVANDDGNETE